MRFSWYLVLCCVVLVGAVIQRTPVDIEEAAKSPREARDTSDPEVKEAVEFFFSELVGLSDSGVYETLSLEGVEDASVQDGVFHRNVLFTLRLGSPHLIDGATESRHRCLVMTSLDDGSRSIAIDEFPVMDEEAIDQFWVKKAKRHLRERQRLFQAFEDGAKDLQQAAQIAQEKEKEEKEKGEEEKEKEKEEDAANAEL